MKNILVINGHPDAESFNKQISKTYIQTLENAGAALRSIDIRNLDFNPNLQYGYRKRTELEPDLLQALKDIHWSDHLVWVYPTWWLSMPALMKGFIDRVFLPGITFRTIEKGKSEGLLKGKSARIITTADMTRPEYEEIYRSSGLVQFKTGILEYCGISPVETTYIGPVYDLNEKSKKEWLEEISSLAIKDLS
ncbi:NAD(P)H-dependent oxidoreductase [Pedobacter caeni]|uniref:Putative NADPH-quinone reductase (Modulator of drug activity B) n=1 Tax=Pedobacter caeni TaxID=288992 RepID=A0A1M5BKS5_9SPHI|nr:NAD(P)H-dependent oxidoreductase [Pedobacter caeni]SHF42857.1 Putative NADPH-quinone reductase (modulator of drug activity B) [Pedobacter caeni]